MKSYKKTALKIAAILLGLAGSISCQDEIADAKGSWVCNPEPNVTITLTFELGTVYVNTIPQNLAGSVQPSGKIYLFSDGSQFVVRGNTLYSVENPNAVPSNSGFIGTMLSPNKMKLQSFGDAFPDDLYVRVKDYIFERKN